LKSASDGCQMGANVCGRLGVASVSLPPRKNFSFRFFLAFLLSFSLPSLSLSLSIQLFLSISLSYIHGIIHMP
jgi:hypothetical protein